MKTVIRVVGILVLNIVTMTVVKFLVCCRVPESCPRLYINKEKTEGGVSRLRDF